MSARLTVYANSNKPVPAKYLEINGEVIRGPSGDPYIVPADFDWNTYMGKFERLKHSLETAENVDRSHPDEIVRAGGYASMVYTFLYDQFHAAWPARPSDVQRTYNGYAGKGEGDFVAAFTPAASFLYGTACAALGLSEEECLAGGGAQNILSARAARRKGQAGAIDTSGKYYNAPINVPHIENGWNAYTNGVSASGGASRKADTSPGHSGKPARDQGRIFLGPYGGCDSPSGRQLHLYRSRRRRRWVFHVRPHFHQSSFELDQSGRCG